MLVTVYDLEARRRWCSAATTTSAWSTPRTQARRRPPTSSRCGRRAHADRRRRVRDQPGDARLCRGERALDVLASLGTGEQTRPLPYDEVKDWGQIEWARPIIDVVFDGSADAVDVQLERADRRRLHPAADAARRGLGRSRRREPGEPRCPAPRGRAADRRSRAPTSTASASGCSARLPREQAVEGGVGRERDLGPGGGRGLRLGRAHPAALVGRRRRRPP